MHTRPFELLCFLHLEPRFDWAEWLFYFIRFGQKRGPINNCHARDKTEVCSHPLGIALCKVFLENYRKGIIWEAGREGERGRQREQEEYRWNSGTRYLATGEPERSHKASLQSPPSLELTSCSSQAAMYTSAAASSARQSARPASAPRGSGWRRGCCAPRAPRAARGLPAPGKGDAGSGKGAPSLRPLGRPT